MAVGVILIPSEVQAWLHLTRTIVDGIDPKLEEAARARVFGRVSAEYDVSEWIDNASTPSMVKTVMAMFYAAWVYKATYAESMAVNSDNYGVKLEASANTLLEQIANNSVQLIDDPNNIPDTGGTIAFYPTDVQEYDELGDEIKFHMGTVF